jgi:hypothetical protein
MTELKKLAERLARGGTTFEEAGRRAREVTAGQKRNVSGVPARVLLSMQELEKEFLALSTYLNELPYDKLERWAGAFVMVHAQMGLGNLQGAADLVRRVAATDPPSERAAELAVAMIDAVLVHSDLLSSALVEQLMAARRARSAPPETPADPATAFDVVLRCLDREGWQYVADREALKVMIQFSFPFGETRLVCSVSDDAHLTVFALEVLRVAANDMPEIERSLASRFAGVRAERDGALGWVTLFFTLPAADRLGPREVRRAVVQVNGAAEYLIMTYR